MCQEVRALTSMEIELRQFIFIVDSLGYNDSIDDHAIFYDNNHSHDLVTDIDWKMFAHWYTLTFQFSIVHLQT